MISLPMKVVLQSEPIYSAEVITSWILLDIYSHSFRLMMNLEMFPSLNRLYRLERISHCHFVSINMKRKFLGGTL